MAVAVCELSGSFLPYHQPPLPENECHIHYEIQKGDTLGLRLC